MASSLASGACVSRGNGQAMALVVAAAPDGSLVPRILAGARASVHVRFSL